MYTVADVMTRKLVTLKETDELALADNIIHLGRVRHLPVVKDGKLVGLVTHRDLLRAYSKKGEAFGPTLLAKEIMRTDLLKVRPETPLRKAFRAMLKNKYGCMPVVDDKGQLLGIVTEHDAVVFALRVIDDVEKLERMAMKFAAGGAR